MLIGSVLWQRIYSVARSHELRQDVTYFKSIELFTSSKDCYCSYNYSVRFTKYTLIPKYTLINNIVRCSFFRFKHFQPEVILNRLVLRKQYAIAIQMAKHLKLSESWILEHWAYHKILHDKS